MYFVTQGIQKYGVPRRICFDNGSQYRTHWMKRGAIHLGFKADTAQLLQLSADTTRLQACPSAQHRTDNLHKQIEIMRGMRSRKVI